MCVLTDSILDDVWNDHIWHTATQKTENILLKHYYYLPVFNKECSCQTCENNTHTLRGYLREGVWGIVKNTEDQINGDGRLGFVG